MRLSAVLLGIALTAPAQATTLELFYSANLNGELEPCGCSVEGDLGGIQRRAAYVDRMREARPQAIWIDGGGMLTGDIASDAIRNRFILEGFAALHLDAVAIQWQDLVHGAGLLAATPMPWLSGNLALDGVAAARTLRRGGRSIHVGSWIDPADSPYRGMARPPVTAAADTVALAGALRKARAEGATTLVITTLARAEALSRLPVDLIDILLVRARPETPGTPSLERGTLVLEPGTRGMRLGRAQIEVGPSGRVVGFTHEAVSLPPAVGKAARLDDWYARYNEALREDYRRRVAVRKALDAGTSPFAGSERCVLCHAGARASWEASDHARAFSKLEDVGKHFDPHCVGCHSVGYEQSGGYLDPSLTPHLQNVQCESCHGAGRAHAEAPATVRTNTNAREACGGCHHPAHSPGFVFELYWPRIAHGRDTP